MNQDLFVGRWLTIEEDHHHPAGPSSLATQFPIGGSFEIRKDTGGGYSMVFLTPDGADKDPPLALEWDPNVQSEDDRGEKISGAMSVTIDSNVGRTVITLNKVGRYRRLLSTSHFHFMPNGTLEALSHGGSHEVDD